MSIFSTKDQSFTENAIAEFIANGGRIKRIREATKKEVAKANSLARKQSRNGRVESREEENPLSISIFSKDERWSIKWIF